MTYLDSCVVIYAVEEKGRLSDRARAALEASYTEGFAISPLVKLECLVLPFKLGDRDLEDRFLKIFDDFEALDLPEAVYLHASMLRARFRLKTPDALHLACAQHHGCDALLTNDNRLDRASDGMARNVFD